MDDYQIIHTQRQLYHELEKVLIDKIKTYGLNNQDSKGYAELILDYGYDGMYDLAMEVNNILENEYA